MINVNKEKRLVQRLVDIIKKNVNSINEQNITELDKVTYMTTPDIKPDIYYLNGTVRTCIQIKRLPETIAKGILDCFKGSPHMMLVIDEHHIPNDRINEFMGKKIDALKEDSSDATSKNDVNNAGEEIAVQDRFANRVFSSKETCKDVTIRIYLKHENLEDLMSLIAWVNQRMKSNNLCGCVQRNLLDQDLKALTMLSNPTKTISTTRGVTNMVMSDDVSEIKPFAFPLGSTSSGAYCPDYFSYDYRSFCVAIMGMQGCGKSHLIKKICKHARLRGEQIIILDLHNAEYADFAIRNHIPSVSLSMNDSINPYQIFRNDEETGVISELVIAEAVSLNVAMFMQKTGLKKDNKAITFYSNMLIEMYEHYKGHKIDEFSDQDWFVVTDILQYCKDQDDKGFCEDVPQSLLFDLKQKLINMYKQYGFFFNRKTNINFDLTKSIRFDLSFLESFDTDDLREAYIALIFSYLGKILRANEKLSIKLEKGHKVPRPLHPVTIVMEETGTLFKSLDVKKRVDITIRQTRKARVQLLLAFHTISDILGGTKEDEELTKSIFGLCACTIIGNIDQNTAEKLPDYAKFVNYDDAKSALKFIVKDDDKEKRRTFLACTDDGKKVKFHSKALSREFAIFGGGK